MPYVLFKREWLVVAGTDEGASYYHSIIIFTVNHVWCKIYMYQHDMSFLLPLSAEAVVDKVLAMGQEAAPNQCLKVQCYRCGTTAPLGTAHLVTDGNTKAVKVSRSMPCTWL